MCQVIFKRDRVFHTNILKKKKKKKKVKHCEVKSWGECLKITDKIIPKTKDDRR